MPTRHIAIIATLDTKRAEASFVESFIQNRGYEPILIDVGPLTSSSINARYSNAQVAGLAGWQLSELVGTGQRDQIMAAMGRGASQVLLQLLAAGQLDGVFGLGGNQGTAIASMAMRSLPLGFPKFLLSTVASGNMRPYVGHKDMGVMFSVADLVGGPNPVSRSILSNAVSALLGMVENGKQISLKSGERVIALTALGNTEPAAHRITTLLQERGYQVITFHASGAGGTAMEELIEAGVFIGVIDLTPHELIEEVVGSGAYVPVREGRMTAAARHGIPQIVSTGALEYLCFGPKESIPAGLRRRRIYFHNPYNANLKASRDEMATVGKVMAGRLNESRAAVEILIPLRGWSVYGSKGGPLYDPQGNRLLIDALKRHLDPKIPVEEIDLHINDPEFADRCITQMINLLEQE